MDPGDYETNTLLIVSIPRGRCLSICSRNTYLTKPLSQNNVASVAFKIYEPVVPSSSPYGFAVSDVEHTLRNEGLLVYADPLRRVLWCFSLVGSDGSLVEHSEEFVLGPSLECCGHSLNMVEEGTLEPLSLLKNRIMTPNSLNTPSTASPIGPHIVDAASRPAITSGVTMPASSHSAEMDVKMSFGSTVESQGYGSMPTKDIYDYFVTSVLASLSQRFCSKTGAIPLDPKSFLLPAEAALADPDASQTSSASILASLRVHLTTTGSLLLGLSLALVQGVCSDGNGLNPVLPLSGSTVLTAPLGMFGTLQAFTDNDQYSIDGSTIQSPDTQVTRFRPDADVSLSQWQRVCSKWLEMRGISTSMLSTSSWLRVQSLRRKPSEPKTDGKVTPVVNTPQYIMWPSALCYRKRTRGTLAFANSIAADSTTLRDAFDAMRNAEAWYMANGEREELLVKRRKERETAASSKDTGDVDSRLLQSGVASHVPRRTSSAAATGGAMYPTPPDGVQVAAGVTAFVDGSISSPGNRVPSAGMGDLDTSLAATGSLSDGFGEGWDATQSKREQSFNQENWELNNDVFVEHDITDADFNFFDEQPNTMEGSIPGVPDLGNGQTSAGAPVQPALQEPALPSGHVEVKMESSPAPPVFAKPELKHARSTLGETRMRDRSKARPAVGIKRQSSPFDPTTVYKKLKASFGSGLATNSAAGSGPGRRGSAFDRLDFDRSFTVVNKKYEHNGRFNFNDDRSEEGPSRRSTSPPTTNYLRQHGKGRATLRESPTKLGAQVAGIAGAVDHDNAQRDAVRADESTSDADDISLLSDQDDLSDSSDKPFSPTRTSVRRRRPADDAEPVASSTRDFELMDEHLVSMDLSKLSIHDSLEVPLPSYFADPEPISPRAILSDDEFIMIAQILTEQAVSGVLKCALPELTHASSDMLGPRQAIMYSLRSSLQTLQAILPPDLQGATACPLRQLVDVQDVPSLATPSRIQPRPPGVGPEQRPSLVQIAPPHLELRRYETKLSVLPSAVSFWESLGLGPSQGHKDILSISVFPNLKGMADSADVFLDRLRSTYESMKLGTFERMTTSPMAVPNGLLPYEFEKTSKNPTLAQAYHSTQPLVDEMARLAVAIFNCVTPPRNFVIFFVYTPDNPGTIIESCMAFQRMSELYKRAHTERKKPFHNEVVLQLVPLDFVATSTSMVVLSPSECVRLCLEVYDRCTLFGGPMPSPAIVLEQQPVTQGLNFQLRPQPSANLLQENSVMHIAYAQSIDERWVTAAWTDNRGCKQMTASYCLGRKDKPLTRTFADIAHEIWMTTNDLTSIWKVHWRIVITKVGSMDQQERTDWMTLAQTEMKSSVSLALLTVDTNPSLQLIPAVSKVSMTSQSAFYSTPVSTPQPSTMSPDQSGNPSTPKPGGGASTPGADNTATEADADAILIDVTDITWGAVVSHRLNTSYSLTDPSPALVSGYLIKRGGSRADDPPAVMEVNVVHSEGTPRMHEVLLREMLSVFRGLGTIARARSVTQKEGDVRPWHVAAVEKGVQALYQLM